MLFFHLKELLDFIATSLNDFVEREENISVTSQQERRELGFTFSFPVKQTTSSSGNLIKWTKGFSVEDMVSCIIFVSFGLPQVIHHCEEESRKLFLGNIFSKKILIVKLMSKINYTLMALHFPS